LPQPEGPISAIDLAVAHREADLLKCLDLLDFASDAQR